MTSGDPDVACAGLLRRKTLWLPSVRGWALCLVAAVVLLMALFLEARPFLSVNKPVPAKVLVLEGWVPDYVLLAAWKEFQQGHYTTLYTVGILGREGGGPDDTYASWAAERLQRLVGPHPEIIAVPADGRKVDRTYASAEALRQWLANRHEEVTALNVVSLGPHARRSRLLFREAFGPRVRVGIISIPSIDYDPNRWWKSSEGLKEIVSEAAAYIYAAVFFHPPN